MASNEFQTISFENRENGLGILKLNRPERRNAVNVEMINELNEFWSMMLKDEETRVVAFFGEGQSFCSGLDLKSGATLPRGTPAIYNMNKTSMDIACKMRKCPQPIVCGMQGYVYGVGFSYALAADIRILAEDLKIQASFTRIGLAGTDTATSFILPRVVGFSNAADILLTARTIEAAEAYHMGIGSAVVPAGNLEEAVLEKCTAILTNGPFGVRLTKWTLNHSIDVPSMENIMALEVANQTMTISGKDFTEGVASLLEKRPADWKNK